MRLTDHQIETIKQATAEIFGPDAQARLFGSRADDSRRGGDVDLMVELVYLKPEPFFKPTKPQASRLRNPIRSLQVTTKVTTIES